MNGPWSDTATAWVDTPVAWQPTESADVSASAAAAELAVAAPTALASPDATVAAGCVTAACVSQVAQADVVGLASVAAVSADMAAGEAQGITGAHGSPAAAAITTAVHAATVVTDVEVVTAPVLAAGALMAVGPAASVAATEGFTISALASLTANDGQAAPIAQGLPGPAEIVAAPLMVTAQSQAAARPNAAGMIVTARPAVVSTENMILVSVAAAGLGLVTGAVAIKVDCRADLSPVDVLAVIPGVVGAPVALAVVNGTSVAFDIQEAGATLAADVLAEAALLSILVRSAVAGTGLREVLRLASPVATQMWLASPFDVAISLDSPFATIARLTSPIETEQT